MNVRVIAAIIVSILVLAVLSYLDKRNARTARSLQAQNRSTTIRHPLVLREIGCFGECDLILMGESHRSPSLYEQKNAIIKELAKTASVSASHDLVKSFSTNHLDMRVRVDAKGIVTTNYLNHESTGLIELRKEIDMAFASLASEWSGNPIAILVTSDSDGWNDQAKRDLSDVLIRPGVCLYVIQKDIGVQSGGEVNF